ncbi:MFS general substrate transporter [Rhizodiscina lignyota]|uniref:MFS general substrate transporter n=1 Tax=Rhizodiscina lignyota TaxID=1504668 RepID=A0A9P4IGI5_9PEZI|nr:MFS general substrate transporter [Rhizodiscina lignyota]
MDATDYDNPMNWPLHRRIYTTACSWFYAFTVAFGLTAYTAGIGDIVIQFNVSRTVAVLPFAIFLWGVSFAPIYSPHLAERFGRSIIYFICVFLFSIFTLGVGYSQNFASIVVLRFFAGFFGGPCLVLIEGTFADIWDANQTNTYYAFLGTASYIGAACGPLVLGFVVQATGWRWTQWVTLMVALASLLFGTNMSESYQREIPRRRNRTRGLPPPEQPAALSGVTLAEMARTTIINPAIQLFTEPVVIMFTIYVVFLFGTVFQFFITVPIVLSTVYNFTLGSVGLAFISAIIGSLLAAGCSIAVEQIFYRRSLKTNANGMTPIELRLIPAMYGGFLMLASFFWIGWTAKPSVNWAVPVVGTGVFVWGNLSVLISLVPYIFDAYPPAGTLAALTIGASARILIGGLIPMLIIFDFTNIGGDWALSIFGFITIVLIPIPFILFKFGPGLRARSRFSAKSPAEEQMIMMMMEAQRKEMAQESMQA